MKMSTLTLALSLTLLLTLTCGATVEVVKTDNVNSPTGVSISPDGNSAIVVVKGNTLGSDSTRVYTCDTSSASAAPTCSLLQTFSGNGWKDYDLAVMHGSPLPGPIFARSRFSDVWITACLDATCTSLSETYYPNLPGRFLESFAFDRNTANGGLPILTWVSASSSPTLGGMGACNDMACTTWNVTSLNPLAGTSFTAGSTRALGSSLATASLATTDVCSNGSPQSVEYAICADPACASVTTPVVSLATTGLSCDGSPSPPPPAWALLGVGGLRNDDEPWIAYGNPGDSVSSLAVCGVPQCDTRETLSFGANGRTELALHQDTANAAWAVYWTPEFVVGSVSFVYVTRCASGGTAGDVCPFETLAIPAGSTILALNAQVAAITPDGSRVAVVWGSQVDDRTATSIVLGVYGSDANWVSGAGGGGGSSGGGVSSPATRAIPLSPLLSIVLILSSILSLFLASNV